MKKILTLFLILLMVSTFVFAGGEKEKPAEAETEAEPSGETEVPMSEWDKKYPEFAANKADIDWRQFEGTEIHAAMLKSVLMDWQVEMIPDFEALTGIKVVTEGYAENTLWQKEVLDLQSHAGQYDMMFTGPFYAPKFVKENWVADLSKFMNDPSLTDKDWYDYEDILGSIRGAFTIGDHVAAIPLDGVTHCLFYRKDLLEENGIEVPTTMEELEAAAEALTMDTDNDGEIDVYGIGLRGAYMQITLPSFIYTYGGGYVNDNFDPVINTQNTKRGIEQYVSLLQNYGPPGSAAKNWTDVLEDFRQGNTAMIIDTDAWATQFEDEEKSNVVGKVGIAKIPGLEEGESGEPGWWSWSIAMNADSKVQGATWLYMMWTTSKIQSLRFSLKRGVTSRNWVTEQQEYLDKVGSLNFGNWLPVFLDGMKNARPDYLATQINGKPIPESTEIIKTVGTEVSSIIAGQKSIDEAAEVANNSIKSTLEKAGY